MAYQSIYTKSTGGNFTPAGSGYQPVNWAALSKPQAAPKFNLNKVNDVPTLNKALHAGVINQSQWMQRFKQIQPKINGVKTPKAYSVGNTVSALGGALNSVFVQPVKSAVTDTASAVTHQVEHLSGRTSTQKERDNIITNQTKAAKNPEYVKATEHIKPGTNSASGLIRAQKMAAQGAKAPQIRTFLDKDAQALANQTKRGINAALVFGTLNPGSGILASKLKQIALEQPETLAINTATKELLNTAEKATTRSNIGSKAIKESNTTHIPVRESTSTTIPVKSRSSKVTGKVVTANSKDKEYLTQSNKLTNRYNQEMSAIKSLSGPVQKRLQQHLDDKYSALQQNLDKEYGKTSISFKGKSVSAEPALPKGSKNVPPKQLASRVQATPLPKKAPKAAGEKQVSGSSLRTEQRAVQNGLENELGNKATYTTVSHKEEAAKATKLLHENPQKAEDIAMGRSAGDNSSHEAAVYHAVANQALKEARKTGDFSKVQALASSPRHTAVSEAAQKLGAEGYNVNPHDPISIMNDVAKSRRASLEKKTTTSVAKAAKSIGKEVNSNLKVSRQDWHSFIQELQCK